jgi:AraC-like DNA-binding protein
LGASFEAARSIFETLCAEVTLEGPAHELRLRAAVLNLLALVTDVLSAQPLQIECLDDWERLRLRLASQLREELNVGDLARSMHMSPSYLIRHFKKLFGASPKAYHTQCRLREAIRLLRETNLSIKFIALDLGFISAKNFQHIFKHHCGVSPLEARTKKLYPASEPSAAASNPFLINRFNLRPPVDPHWMKRFTPAAAEFIKRGLPVPPS